MARIELNTHQKARQALAKMIKDFQGQSKEERDVPGFRAVVYGFSVLLAYFNLDESTDLVRRIEKLEGHDERTKS